MRFYQARLPAMIWMTLAAANVVVSVERCHRHHFQDNFALVQGVMWMVMLCVWLLMVTTRWTFTENALEQRRAFWSRSVPYGSITAVEPPGGSRREAAVIVYGEQAMFSQQERLTVQPQDFADFMAELERRAPQAAFHV